MNGWKPGDKLLNKYIIEKKLAEGNLSSVYLVRRLINDEHLALKVFKKSSVSTAGLSSMYYNELKIWMDLPDHPNITKCRFFRTIEDRLAVFSDYVDGGTLQDWINQNRLLSIDKILDVAIRCAWALQVAHDNGIVHQDIKTDNILMRSDGTPQITDFGISSILHSVGRNTDTDGDDSQSTGLTLAYCSPEQFHGKPVDHRTDIWSYGIVLTYMFTGKLFHGAGYMAREILNYDFKVYNPPYPHVPVSIVQLLDRCFQIEPDNRWQRFSDIADMLIAIYKEEVGRTYPRKKPVVRNRWVTRKTQTCRLTPNGLFWDDPVEWIEKAYERAGWDKSDISHYRQKKFFSPRTQALSDIELYEQAEEIFLSAFEEMDSETELLFSGLLLNKALVYETVSDWKQAVQNRDRAIRFLEKHVFKSNRYDLANELAGAYTKQGWLYVQMGDLNNGMKFYDKSLELRKVLVDRQSDLSIKIDLAQTYMSKALALQNFKDLVQAQVNMDIALNMMESLMDQLKSEKDWQRLVEFYIVRARLARDQMDEQNAFVFLSKADSLMKRLTSEELFNDNFLFSVKLDYCRAVVEIAFGNLDKAYSLLDRLTARLEDAVYKKGQIEYRVILARIYQEKANTLKDEKNLRDARLYLDETIKIVEELVYDEGREEQGRFLAKLYLDKAAILVDMENKGAAYKFFEKSIRLYRWLIEENGQIGLQRELVQAQIAQADFFRQRMDYHSVLQIYHHVVETLHKFVYQKNQKELMGELAKAKCFLAEALLMTGQRQQARKNVLEFFKLSDLVLPRTGSIELQKIYLWAKQRFRSIVQ